MRRLTAMLAADVAGYSRLMGADEEGTHERLKMHLGELVNPKIREHRGRTVKNTGDGLLAEFASVVDAVRCAVEIQRGMTDREAELPQEQRIRFRIGVNLGDVIVEKHDIFGDGVNVAARLEALAEPGGICVSRVARDQVRDKLDFAFEDLGERHVKNIARPVRVYRVRAPAVPIERPLPTSPQPSPLSAKPDDHETFVFGSLRLIPEQRTLLDDGKSVRLGSRADALPWGQFDTYIVVAKLAPFTPEEIALVRTLNGPYQNRVILLTARELEPYHIYERTEAELGIQSYGSTPEELASVTARIYFTDPENGGT